MERRDLNTIQKRFNSNKPTIKSIIYQDLVEKFSEEWEKEKIKNMTKIYIENFETTILSVDENTRFREILSKTYDELTKEDASFFMNLQSKIRVCEACGKPAADSTMRWFVHEIMIDDQMASVAFYKQCIDCLNKKLNLQSATPKWRNW
ncbi:MAG: hypothetical protein JXR60_11505 [Bacteroidales bacterium]|nr:hypothetical protein [Bacteroidales bacterium]